MTKAKHYFFIMLLAIIALLFLTLAMAADSCTCNDDDDCSSWDFCDVSNLYTIPGDCAPDIYEFECYGCRAKNETCLYSDDSDCCSSRNCTGIIGNRHCCDNGEIWNATAARCQLPTVNTCYELGGDSACTAPKSQCCGGPNAGHCEVCCAPQTLYNDCPSCQYCNTTAGINNYKCSPEAVCCSDIGESCTPSCCSGLVCSNNHCCNAGEVWDTATGKCQGSCPVSVLPEGEVAYACANAHTGGSIEYSGACGAACFNYWYNGVKYSEACGVTEQCVEYESYYDYNISKEGVKFCHGCVENLAACCVSGMAAKSDEECKACNPDWYFTDCHCCPKGSVWNSFSNSCLAADPCYFYDATYSSASCKFGPPNFLPRYQVSWWGSSPACIDSSGLEACCYIGPGYGYLEWYFKTGIIVY